MSAIRQIVYVSHLSRPFSAAELKLLVAVAQRNNRRRDLTGVLACSDGRFFQVLEGSPENIEAAMTVIRADPRHHGIVVLLDREVPTRRWPAWSMVFVGARHLDPIMASEHLEVAQAEALFDTLEPIG